MSNEHILAQLWAHAGQSIDEQRLRIFRIMTASQQREVLDKIERESTNQANKNKEVTNDQSK